MKKYTEGFDTKILIHIPEISHYNYNYYVGIDKDLLLAISDDDNTTEWYFKDDLTFVHFANSFTSEGDVLHIEID